LKKRKETRRKEKKKEREQNDKASVLRTEKDYSIDEQTHQLN